MRNNPALNFTLFALLLLALLGSLTWFNYRFSVQNPGGNDFLARWMGANRWLQQGLSPYDERVSRATQQRIYGHLADVEAGEDKSHFVYPMYSMVFFGPFGLLDYTMARALWMTLLEASLVGSVLLGLRLVEYRPPLWMVTLLLLFSLLWYHGARTVVIGQFAALNAFLVVLALYWIMKEQDLPAGIVLALTTSKPQMVYLLVPFILIWAFANRRFRIIAAFFGALSALVAVSMFLVPDWPLRMAGQMIEYTTYTFIGSPLSIIAAVAPGIQPLFGQVLHAVLYLYLLVQWFLSLRQGPRGFLWVALMTLVVTNLTAFRTATTNFVVLLPVLLLVFRIWEQRWKGAGRALILLILLALLAGLWALALSTVQGNVESAAMYIPLPVISFLALWWARWWAVRPPRLLLEEVAARLG